MKITTLMPLDEGPPSAADPTPKVSRKWRTKRAHPQYTLVADECPNCTFPEAEGGYCPECGWSLPYPKLRRRN